MPHVAAGEHGLTLDPQHFGSTLGELLTENAAPRYAENYWVECTRDRVPRFQLEPGPGSYYRPEIGTDGRPILDPSKERLLANAIAASGGDLSPADVLKMALDATGGDYPLATLTVHNLLKELTYASREGTSALVGWNPLVPDRYRKDDRIDIEGWKGEWSQHGSAIDLISPQVGRTAPQYGYDVLGPAEVQALIGKLSNLRQLAPGDPHGADKMGPWYHMYGTLFLGSMTTGTEAGIAVWVENFLRYLGLGSDPDPGKEKINTCAGKLAGLIADLPAPPAPAEESP